MINFVQAGGRADAPGEGLHNLTLLHDLITNKTVNGNGGPRIYFPPGTYHFSGPIRVRKAVYLMGSASGTRTGYNTIFRFPRNSHGIVLDHHDTNILTYQPEAGISAEGSIIEGIMFQGESDARNEAHGIIVRCQAVLRNVEAKHFGGHGIFIWADNPENGPKFGGQASNCLLENCGGWENAQSGLCIAGGDTNIIHVVGGDFTGNGDWGIEDRSFLGCTFSGVHTSQNAQPYLGHRGGTQTHLVRWPNLPLGKGGKNWLIREANVAAGRGAEPGTDANVWVEYTGPLSYDPPAWNAANISIRPGGSFLTAYGTAWSVWTGCYAEGNQGGSQMGYQAIVIGGDHDYNPIYATHNGGSGEAAWLDAHFGELKTKTYLRTKGIYLGLTRNRDGVKGMKMTAAPEKPSFGSSDRLTKLAAHSDYSYARGDIVWNENASTTQAGVAPPLGWRCTNGPNEFEEIPFPSSVGGSTTIADGSVTTVKLADNSVTNAKLADMPDYTVKGRVALGEAGDPVDVNVGTLTTHMPRFTDADNNLLQKRGIVGNEGISNTTDFLRRDGVWAQPPGGSGAIADNSVTNAKLSDMPQNTFKGRRNGAGTGDPQELTPGEARSIIASDTNNGSVFLAGDGTFKAPPSGGGSWTIDYTANRPGWYNLTPPNMTHVVFNTSGSGFHRIYLQNVANGTRIKLTRLRGGQYTEVNTADLGMTLSRKAGTGQNPTIADGGTVFLTKVADALWVGEGDFES